MLNYQRVYLSESIIIYHNIDRMVTKYIVDSQVILIYIYILLIIYICVYIYYNIIYEWLSREDEQETRGFQVLLWMLVRMPPNGHRRGRISRTWRSVALEFSGIKMAPLRPIFLVVMDSFSLDSDSGQGPTWQLWPCILDFGESHDFIQFSETQEYTRTNQLNQPVFGFDQQHFSEWTVPIRQPDSEPSRDSCRPYTWRCTVRLPRRTEDGKVKDWRNCWWKTHGLRWL
jgi:hypothetical protein